MDPQLVGFLPQVFLDYLSFFVFRIFFQRFVALIALFLLLNAEFLLQKAGSFFQRESVDRTRFGSISNGQIEVCLRAFLPLLILPKNPCKIKVLSTFNRGYSSKKDAIFSRIFMGFGR